jgi:hypothetical protein
MKVSQDTESPLKEKKHHWEAQSINVEEVNGADLLPTKRCGLLLIFVDRPDPQISDASKP